MSRPLSPDFARKLEEHSLKPLWTIARDLNTNEPRTAEQAEIWRWADFQPLIAATIAEVSVEDAVRRVLIMANPAYGGKPATAGSLNACLQILQPGEVAPPHRHSISAIRLITSAAGGITMVDDAACPMREGDLILTPGWCWHAHRNDTDRGVAWIDILDVPLVTGFDAVFFEPGSGNMPPGRPNAGPESYRHEWAAMRTALDATPPAADGSRVRRYVDPVHGGAIMPTIDCDALALAAGRETQANRSTAGAVCFVVAGEGSSTIGGRRIDWRKNDVFTLPHWQWVTHCASVPSYLIVTSNREMLLRLGLLVTETEEGGVRRRRRAEGGSEGGGAENA